MNPAYRACFGEPVPRVYAVMYANSVESLNTQIAAVLARYPGAPVIREKCECFLSLLMASHAERTHKAGDKMLCHDSTLLNDARWSSPLARADGLRDLGLAQLGSLGVVDDKIFASRLAEKLILSLIPKLFREVFPGKQNCLDAAKRCEEEGTANAAYAATAAGDEYLLLCASLALEVLSEMGSPGCALLSSVRRTKQ